MHGSAEAAVTAGDVGVIDDVVRRAQAGDVDAFGAVYQQHAAAMFTLCRRMAGDDARARELLQDVFVRAWERLTTFRGESSLATWLHRLGANVVLEQLRSAKRDDARMVDGNEEIFGSRSTGGQIEAGIDLEAALLHLPNGARIVFVLHDVEGYSHEEIARMTGIAAGTSRAQLWRARRALMALVDR